MSAKCQQQTLSVAQVIPCSSRLRKSDRQADRSRVVSNVVSMTVEEHKAARFFTD
jgi:hypothetical protein